MRPARRWARAAALAAVAPGAVAAVADATGIGERRLRGMQAAPFGLLLSMPAPLAAAAAVVAGWPLVGLAAVPVAAWHLGLVDSPATRTANARTGRATSGIGLRLATINIERDVPTAAEIVEALLASAADVVVVQELTPTTQPAFGSEPFRARYPHRFEAPEDGFFGAGVYSRFPIAGADDRPLGGRHMVVADLDVGGTPVTLVSVHTQAPIHPRDIVPWQSGFTDLGRLAAAAAATDRPIVLAGDWNATTGNRPFRRLLRDHRLVDAHLAVGRGRACTWPAHRSPLPPLLLLDHVVVGGGIVVHGVHERPAPGSDHLAVVADLEIPTPNSSE